MHIIFPYDETRWGSPLRSPRVQIRGGKGYFSIDLLEFSIENEPRHAIMCLREINYVMRYDVVKSDVIISRRA